MHHTSDVPPPRARARGHSFRDSVLRVSAGALVIALASCSGGDSPNQNPGGGSSFAGVGNFYFEDSNFGGNASSVRIAEMGFGRLVELFGENASGDPVLMASDYVIDQNLTSSANNFTIETNAVTGQVSFTVHRNVEDPTERAQFLSIARAAAEAIDPIQVRDLNSTGVFSMVPRNAAVVIVFDDLLDPGSISETTVQLLQGDPPSTPIVGRVFPSRNFGGTSSNGTFYPSRVVFDLTVSQLEAQNLGIQVNPTGLIPSQTSNVANAQLRIPTRLNSTVGINRILRNLAGSALATTGNGPVDFGTATQPVTRAFRSGGSESVTGDPFNGFLRDEVDPVLVGSTQIEIVDPPVQVPGSLGVNSREYLIPRIEFASQLCATPTLENEVIVQSGVFARVIGGGGNPLNGVVTNVRVTLEAFPAAWPNASEWEASGAGIASYERPYDAALDVGREPCFVQILPAATGAPANPGTGVAPDSQFTLRFSEPMEPTSLTAFDSLTLTRSAFDPMVPTPSSSYVVGSVAQTQDLRGVRFVPVVALSHEQGQAEEYFLRVANPDDDAFPPTDLAGNTVGDVPEINFTIEPTAMTQFNGGRVNRFPSIDEEGPEGAEFAGQVLVDTTRQLLRARPVLRSQVVLDNNQPLLAQQTFIPGGVVTPHSPFGSKLQAMWRYCDCGFGLTDQQDQAIDIEGLYWRPAGGAITADNFSRFEIRLAHSRRLPDEFINPANAWPQWNNSGLRPNFSINSLPSDRPDVPSELVVHPRELGYDINPGEAVVASTGTTLLPFPLNQDPDFEDNIYFTWRDPRIRARAPQQNNGGTEPYQWFLARGLPAPPFPGYRPYYRPDQCQTIALPLLMEFRVFPDLSAVGQNGWDFNIAANSSSQPYFRAFSTGGTNSSGALSTVDPDNSDIANGGFNPNSTPTPGAPTPGRDNVVYHGAIDYVTRVSFSPSIWFEAEIAGEPSFGGRTYNAPIIEPAANQQPPGTELRIEYRGASSITYLNDEADWNPGDPDPQEGGLDNDGDPQNDDPTPGLADFQVDAFKLDLYGDYYNDADNWTDTSMMPPEPRILNPWPDHRSTFANPGLGFLNGDETWKFDVEGLEGARYYQVRLQFIGNPESGLTPEVSAFAMTWTRQ